MPLDRSWYNSLIDDDGTNTVGSVWNKAAIDGLLDTIDAALLRIDPVKTPWTPAILTAEGASCLQAGSNVDAHYSLSGRMLFWSIYAVTLLVPASTASLRFGTPPGYIPSTYNDFSVIRCVPAPGVATAFGYIYSDPSGQLVLTTTANFGSGTTHFMGQGFYWF